MAGVGTDAVRLGFITFTTSAAIVAGLAAHAERRRLEALTGRREIERLYRQLQSAFDRASEVEAARRNEQLKAALLDALTHNLRTPLTAIKAAVTALMGDRRRARSAGAVERRPPRAAAGDRRGIGPTESLHRRPLRRGAPRRAQPASRRGAPVRGGDRRGDRPRLTVTPSHRVMSTCLMGCRRWPWTPRRSRR